MANRTSDQGVPSTELRRATQDKLGLRTRQALENRAKTLQKKYGPMSLDEAIALMAHDAGINVSKYLSSMGRDRIRQIEQHRAILDSPEARQRATSRVPRVINVVIGGDFDLSDPILPLSVLSDAKAMANVYAKLYVFENSVREVINRVMSKRYGDSWWNERMACSLPDVYGRVKGLMKSDEKNAWHGGRRAHPVCYTEIGDLGKIVVTWWNDFKPLFPSQEWVTQRIGEIERSRNVVAHHNPLSTQDRRLLELYFVNWMRQIDSVKSELT